MHVIYVPSVELIKYAADRGILIDEDKASILTTQAQDYIDNAYSYCGHQVYDSSAFPRHGLKKYDSQTVPVPIKNAVKYIALQLQLGAPILAGSNADTTKVVKKEKVSMTGVEKEYAVSSLTKSTRDFVLFSHITNSLYNSGLLCGSAFSVNLYALRG